MLTNPVGEQLSRSIYKLRQENMPEGEFRIIKIDSLNAEQTQDAINFINCRIYDFKIEMGISFNYVRIIKNDQTI